MTVKVSQCCCGCSLKTGANVIGVLTLLGSLYGLYNTSRTVLFADLPEKELSSLDKETREAAEMMYKVGYYSAMVQIPVIIMWIISTIVLLFGVQNDVPSSIRYWVMYSVFGTFVSLIISLVITYTFFVYESPVFGWVVLAVVLFYISLQAYFIIVVHSYYLQLLENEYERSNDMKI